MKHTDETLQAAIDAAMLEIGRQTIGNNFAASLKYDASWPAEQSDRLALAKAFLAKLPEAQPVLADDGRSLTDLRADNLRLEKELAHQTDMASQAAVCGPKVALDEAIRRMEAVSNSEITNAYWQAGDGYENIRSRLIAAARGEAVGINGLTEAEEAKTASVAGLSKTASSTFEAHGKTWNCHTPSDPRPCSGDSIINIYCEGDIKEHAMIRCHASEVVWSCQTIRGWRYADEPDSTDWKTRAEKAEAQVADMREALQEAHTTLESIARAKPSEWGEMSDQFKPWAQNRARHAFIKLQPFIKP